MADGTLSLASLGLTEDALADRLVDKLAEGLLSSLEYEEDGSQFRDTSAFARKLNAMVKARLDALVERLGNEYVLPRVDEMVENLVLQETNKWGEKTGKSMTFTEYLVGRAEVYMTEPLNFDGKTKEQSDSYTWRGTQTRVAHMIHQHLHYSIETAMKEALASATGSIARGLNETVRLKLNEVAAGLKVEVKSR